MKQSFDLSLKLILANILLLVISPAALACEPILPLIFLTSSPNFMAIGWVKQIDIAGIALAVLAVVVLFKCFLFGWLERKKMGMGRAFWYMFLGNILTSFVGLGASAVSFSGAPEALLLGLGITFALAIPPAKRLSTYLKTEKGRKISPYTLALLVPLLLFMSLILFALSQSQLSDLSTYTWYNYWFLKLAYVLVGLGISMFLTTIWEEYIIFRCSGEPRQHFIPSAVRANLYTFLLVGIIGAAIALPQRLQSDNFLIGLLEQLKAVLT